MPKTKTKTAEKNQYIVSLKLNDELKTFSAPSVIQAFELFPKPDFYKTMGVITVTKDSKSRQQLFNIMKLKRFFYSPIVRNVWAKIMTI